MGFDRREAPREIAFLLRFGVDRQKLLQAGELARRLNVSPEAALLGEGWISEKAFYMALATELGAPYYDGSPRIEEGVDFEAALTAGFARLAPNPAGLRAVVAPRGAALRLLLGMSEPTRARLPIAIASRQRLAACLRAQCASTMAADATLRLCERDPAFSANSGATTWQWLLLAAFLAGLSIVGAEAPFALRVILSVLFWCIFSCAVWLRSMAVAAHGATREGKAMREADLPLYTVVAPLYHEGGVAAQLVDAIDALDYPGIM